jgi:hypothetical protein
MVEITLQQVFAAPTLAAMSRLIVERERKPGQSQKIASLVQKLKKMSPQEREAMRARQQVAGGKAGK